ncbi:hypothetical protein BCR42DRAFT_409297 [Absidia repens]|uniref:Uncharacterized protein n=1 Tax=Absidia repens TaxID=90262 RepID=A0A1X2IQY1_9FUNG|nr:hypothetical protein BCR42DRAFT_409297 [Absidia repens]
MDTVEDYPNHPLTTTRMIAWDSPSTWSVSSSSPQHSSTTSTSQPLTVNNLSAYVDAQSSAFADSKSDIMTRYYTSMKNNHHEAMRLSPKSVSSVKSSAAATQTKNIAIDAHPLPFPYHNDCTFLPTVETGRTRFDSESTQSLYDSQPSSPTLSAFSQSKRHLYSASRGGVPSPSLTSTRYIPGYQRYRRGSSTSHYSTVTTATGTTSATASNYAPKSDNYSTTQRRRSSFRATKRQLNTLINNNRYIPSGAQRRLSMLLAKKEEITEVNKHHQPSDQQSSHLTNVPRRTIYSQHGHTSSPSLSTDALYSYYQTSATLSQEQQLQHQQDHHRLVSPSYMETTTNMATSLSTTPSSVSSSSPPQSPVTTYSYTTNSDAPTVISSSTFPHESSIWQNQLVYMSSPSDQYQRRHNKPTPSLPSSHRKYGFFVRFARKLWPFRHV